MMRLKELVKNIKYARLENFRDCEIKGISPNSQNVSSGFLFVAINGEQNDGHNFINQAIDKGAKAVILQKDTPFKEKIAKILVSDSRVALAGVCESFFGHPAKKLKVIGVTGTNGKTTVSCLTEGILAHAGYPSGVVGTLNYRLANKQYAAVNTTPGPDLLQAFLQETVLANCKYAIIEASSHALAQHRVDSIDFSTAIFTNLSREHLDYHRNLENYFSCKSTLFGKLIPQGRAIINIDDAWGRKLVKKIKSKKLTFGIEHPAGIQAKNIKPGIKESRFTAVTPKGNIEIKSSLIGRHNIYNILAAIGAAFIENIEFSHISSGIKDCAYVPGRLERIDCGQNFLVFVDYAHTDDALKKVLLSLRQVCQAKIILVFGCGGNRDKSKRPRMGKVATLLSDYAFITSDNPRSEDPGEIVSDITSGIDQRATNYKIVLDRFKAISQALAKAKTKDIVVIAGKGHESSQILANKTIPFNDRKVVQELLQCSPLKKY